MHPCVWSRSPSYVGIQYIKFEILNGGMVDFQLHQIPFYMSAHVQKCYYHLQYIIFTLKNCCSYVNAIHRVKCWVKETSLTPTEACFWTKSSSRLTSNARPQVGRVVMPNFLKRKGDKLSSPFREDKKKLQNTWQENSDNISWSVIYYRQKSFRITSKNIKQRSLQRLKSVWNGWHGGNCSRRVFYYPICFDVFLHFHLSHIILTKKKVTHNKKLPFFRPRLHWNVWVVSDVIWNKSHASHWNSFLPFFC